jgi:hypothetical protein
MKEKIFPLLCKDPFQNVHELVWLGTPSKYQRRQYQWAAGLHLLVASYRTLTFLCYHQQAICSLSHYDERDILNNKYFQISIKPYEVVVKYEIPSRTRYLLDIF